MSNAPDTSGQLHRASSPGVSGAGFSLILALFASGRLMLLLAFPPENLITYGDYQHYFNLASLTERGFYPFLHYWYEFPPIFPYLNIAVYTVAGGALKNYIILLALVLLVVECANLFLLYRLAALLYGRGRAVTTAWIYTALFVPVFFWLGNFDALTTFFVLLGLYALLREKHRLLAAALGVGAMVKVVPVLLLAPLWRLRGLKITLIYAAAIVIIGLLFFGPFLAASPQLTLASMQAQARKSSYQTVWALLDGNYTTGNFGPISDHFEAEKATIPVNNPPVIPTWLTLIPFAALGLFVLTRPRRLADSRLDAVIFTAFTFVLFFLWSQGWSPQWQTFLIPLVLLALPLNRAVMFVLVLGFINFLEWPVILSRGMNQLLSLTIAARTLVLLLLAWELFQRLKAKG
ncbi:MAG: DUF2029 domain-containing protein [Chloroflexi bacterium]|nr:MAG: DUF2029 domain-containing protein [Chloroflexota bacterium]